MRTLYLIRHAKSSWAEPGLKDFDRPLNARGLRDAPFMATMLKGKGVELDKIVSSPALRAFTTATFFAEAFDIAIESILKEKDIYEAYPEDIRSVIESFDDSCEHVALFGHNPGFTQMANVFATDYISNMPTCSIVQVSMIEGNWANFFDGNASVRAFYFPKQYFE